MTKEEILEKSRGENKNQDVYDLEIKKKASGVAIIATNLLVLIVFGVNLAFAKHPVFELLMIAFGMDSVLFVVKFLKMKKLHELFVAICYAAGFVSFLVLWIKSLIG